MSTRTLVLTTLLLVPTASAEVPIDTYPQCGEVDRPDLCPPDLAEDWEYLSYVPEHARDTVREAELELGSGNGMDRAWRITTGRFDVLLAVVDSGVTWSSTHYNEKIFVNVGELPLPQDADGVEAADHDYDGNGLVNVSDWVDDPRVSMDAGQDDADGILDASDLIYTFSDGVDDDGNGYVDDIAGWDFFGNDNDAFSDWDDGFGEHADGVIRELGAEGGDTDNTTIGVCPNCAVLPVRIGDSFVTDGTRSALGIAYAVDMGAVGITQSVGALSSPSISREAVDYAWANGALVAGATGDENSYHHNQPAALDNALFVHSIRHDTNDDDGQVYSYMNTWNCNNYGMRVSLVTASGACATGSVAVTVGVIGLVESAARDAGLELSSAEKYQLLTQTTDDVWLSDDELSQSGAYPSEEGWDPFYGYGRIDAAQAVEAIAEGRIPPAIELESPSWFDVVDPTRDPELLVVGTISADRSTGFTYEVAYGTGWDPRDWTVVEEGQGTDPADGTLATIDLTQISVEVLTDAAATEGIVERLERANRPALTVRVRATDDDGNTAERRKTLWFQDDPDLLPGFPLRRVAGGEGSPQLADLDGDGVFEIVLADADGRVDVLRGDTTSLDGFPVYADPLDRHNPNGVAQVDGWVNADLGDGFIATPAVGDLDGDGSPEIVAASLFGQLYAWHADGSRVDGFPTQTLGRAPEEFDRDHRYDQGYAGAPTLVDIDDDGTLEIVVGAMDQRLYVWTHQGEAFGGYPIELCYPDDCGSVGTRIVASPSVGDIDGDGDIDIVIGTNEGANDGKWSVTYLIDGPTGTALPGSPVTQSGLVAEAVLLPLIGEGHPSSSALVDLDGDGDLEMSDPIMLGLTDVLDHTGEPHLELGYYADTWGEGTNADDVPSLVQFVTNPAWGDMDGDGTPDLVLGGGSALYLASLAVSRHMDFQLGVGGWSGATGVSLPGWPRQIEDVSFLMAASIADVSGDGVPEALYGSGGFVLHAWDMDGVEPDGWPKFVGGWMLGSPAIGDIDGDGYLDVVATTREGHVWAWRTSGNAGQDVQWAGVHHDAQNTGNYETPLPTQVGAPDGEHVELKGCCANRSKGTDTAWLLAPLGLLAFGRRRRRQAP